METELKFEVDPTTADRLAEDLALTTRGEQVTLTSVYYDTAKADLRRQGLTLRVREDGGGRRVQTVKQLTTGGFQRGEWETDLDGPEPDLDANPDSPLAKALGRKGRAGLNPAFEVTVERARRTMTVKGGVVEISLDRGAVSADGYGAPICELELELKSGPPVALFDLARHLAQSARLDLSFVSKADRGFALMDGKAVSPVKSARPTLARGDTADRAFRAIAASTLAQITANARVLRAARRPEAVHQLRVGVRRLRTAIGLFGPMLADDRRGPLKAELKWITRELDEARDLDVFIAETFRPIAASHPRIAGLAALGTTLLAAQTRAYDRVEKALRSERFGELTLEAAAWIETGAWSEDPDEARAALRARPAATVAAEVLGAHYHKLVRRGRKLEALKPATRHHLRIRAKKLRYAADFFSGLYVRRAGRRLVALTDALGEFQGGLGDLNDIVVGEALVARLAGATTGGLCAAAGKPDVALAFAAGQVCAARQADASAAMKRALKAHDRLAEIKPAW